MQAQYNWIIDQLGQGKTVLAYNRKVTGKPVSHLRDISRVSLACGIVYVDGAPAKGWTFAVKP